MIEKINEIIMSSSKNDFDFIKNQLLNQNYDVNKISINDFKNIQNSFILIRTSFTDENKYIIIERNKNGFFINEKKVKIKDIIEFDIMDAYEIKKRKECKIFSNEIFNESTRYFIISFLANIFLFSLSLIINYYIKIVFDKLIPSQNIKVILLISFVFLTINFFKIITNILLNIYETKRINFISANIYEKALLYNYYVNNESFIKNLSYLNIYIKKHIFDRPDFYSSVFINIIIFIITLILNYLMSLIILFSIVSNLCISYIKFKINSIYTTKSINLQNDISTKMISFNSFCSSEKNFTKFNYYKNNVISSFNKYINNGEKYKIYEYKTLIISELISKIIYYISVTVISYLVIIESSFSISTLLIFLGLLEISNTNSNIIFSFLSTYKEYSQSKMIYKNINSSKNNKECSLSSIPNEIKCYNVSLNKNDKILNLDKISLKNDTIIFGKNGIGKTSLFKKILSSNNIVKNNLFINDFIYQTSTCNIDLINWSDLMSNPNFGLFMNLINKYNIHTFDNLSQGKKQILNFILLIFEKNKIILLDESLSNVDDKNRKTLLKEIKPIIEKNNFLLMISHNKNDEKFFKHKEDLNERF